MQTLGDIGASRYVAFFADGDGDFRPKFLWSDDLDSDMEPVAKDANGNRVYDAG